MMTVVLSVLTAVATYYAKSIEGVFTFLIAFGSGTGLVYILRWFWWRINAWSEISAMATSTIMAVVMYKIYPETPYVVKLLSIISVSTVAWVGVTFITSPVSNDKLIEFVRRVRPAGPGWARIRRLAGDDPKLRGDSLSGAFVEWGLASVLVGSLTVGIGKVILGYTLSGNLWVGLSVICAVALWKKYSAALSQHG